MRLRAVLLLLALAWAGFGAARGEPSDPGVTGTLPEDYLPGLRAYLDNALRQSPEMIKDALDIDVADAQKLYNGIAPMLPHVGASMTYGDNWLEPGRRDPFLAFASASSTVNQGSFYDVNFQQPVFKWGQLKNQLQVQKIQVAITERSYADAYQSFVNTLRSQYLGLITAKLEARNARYVHELAQRQLAAVRQQIKEGTATNGALAGAQIAEAQANLGAEQADESYAFARREFAREVGIKDIADGAIPDAVPEPRFSEPAAELLLASLLSTGARYTPQAQALLMNIRSQELQYKIQKVQQLPMISITADMNQQNQVVGAGSTVQQTAITNQSYYLRADWDVFDGLATHGRKEEALLRRRQLERELKMTADELMDQAQNQERMVKFAWDQLAITTQVYGQAQVQLAVSKDDLKRGVGSTDAVDNNRLGLYNAEVNLMNDRARFLAAWSGFVAEVGHDPAMDRLPRRYVEPVR